MSCKFMNVRAANTGCKENPAGLSNHVFAVPLDADHVATMGVHEGKNVYVITPAANGTALKGFRIDFKGQTGQVTSEPNSMGAGWSHTGTGRVEMNEDDMAYMSRQLHNTDRILYFFPTGKVTAEGAEYKVVGNQFGETEWAVSADSGAQRSDDHGQTFTVTCAYQVYPVMKWYGTIEQEDDPTSSELIDDDSDTITITD